MKPEERVQFRKEMKNRAEMQHQKPVQKPLQKQKVNVEKVKRTDKGLVISFTKA